jgi:hypothetical protein
LLSHDVKLLDLARFTTRMEAGSRCVAAVLHPAFGRPRDGTAQGEDMHRLLREEVCAPLTSVCGHAKTLAQSPQLSEIQLYQVKLIESAAITALDAIDHSIGAPRR